MIKRPLSDRFTEKVRAGVKRTTIRESRWPEGAPVMLYNWSGAPYRSKHADVMPVWVFKVSRIEIAREGERVRFSIRRVDGRPLWEVEGFESEADLEAWFRSKMKDGQRLQKWLMQFRPCRSWEGGEHVPG